MNVSTLSISTDHDGIDWLFGELHGRYGNRFLDAYRSGITVDGVDTGIANMKRTWSERIRANRLTTGQVRRGLAECERLKFPPTWGEFLEFCQPALDPVTAYQEALAGLEARGKGEIGLWSHPAVYWAASEMRADLMGQTWGAVRERWAAALRRHLARGEWESVPPPRAALPAPGGTTTTREEAGVQLRALTAAGLLRSFDQYGANLSWAEKILVRAAAGEHVAPYALHSAHDALGKRNRLGPIRGL